MNFLDTYVEKKQLETIINNIEISCFGKAGLYSNFCIFEC